MLGLAGMPLIAKGRRPAAAVVAAPVAVAAVAAARAPEAVVAAAVLARGRRVVAVRREGGVGGLLLQHLARACGVEEVRPSQNHRMAAAAAGMFWAGSKAGSQLRPVAVLLLAVGVGEEGVTQASRRVSLTSPTLHDMLPRLYLHALPLARPASVY